MLTFLLTTLLSMPAVAAEYDCSTEFGETVPLKFEVSGKPSREWNGHVARDPSLGTAIKRHELRWQNRPVYLETRYAKRTGPNFRLTMTCDSKCRADFGEARRSFEFRSALYDQRTRPNEGHVELALGDRDVLSLRARITKAAVATRDHRTHPVSASGELGLFSEAPRFTLDAGADEHFELLPGLRYRLAAFEIKIICVKRQ